jgi:hypothetical protein
MEVGGNKSEIKDNSFVSNFYQNSVMNTNMFNQNENFEDCNNNFLKENLNINANQNKNHSNIHPSKINTNIPNNSIIKRNNNLKNRILNDKSNNNSVSKSPDAKKKVVYEDKNYISKIKNKNENKINDIKYLNKSYNDNIINTGSSIIKKKDYTDKLNLSIKLNRKILKNTKNNFPLNAVTTSINKNQYLRSLVKTNAERFKKGFFNTSVSYEKSADVRNRTFDGKMYNSSKSRSREKSPIVSNFINNILLEKNLLNSVKKDENKRILYKKLNNPKFQPTIVATYNSRNNSASKREGNNYMNLNNELRKTNGLKKNPALNTSLNKNNNLPIIKDTYKLK